MDKKIILDIEGIGKIVSVQGKTLEDIVKENNISNALAALVNNELQELNYVINMDSSIKFVSNRDRIGSLIYISGLKFLFITAVKELFGKDTDVLFKHSLDKGMFSILNKKINEEKLTMIKNKMKLMADLDIKIKKVTTTTKDAMNYFKDIGEYEKQENYKMITSETVTLYSLLDYYNYFFTAMPVSTGCLKEFDLTLIDEKMIVLRYPEVGTGKIEEYESLEKIAGKIKDYFIWANKLNVNYVSDVNRVVINNRIKEFIQLNEINHNQELDRISKYIEKNIDKIKLICIAGPSSSGKTTTSKKL